MENSVKRRASKLLQLSLIFLILSQSVAQEDWNQNCGALCKCKWVSGKKTAECIRQKFTYIPSHLSSEIQILDLTENHIPYLPQDAFTSVELVNLQKLVLRSCEIDSVDTYAFNGLKIVIEIDLSWNNIKKIFPGTFVETERLRILQLNDNNLEFLDNGLFQDLTYLQKIVLSNNNLARIGERTFRNLPGLHTLTLNNNNLTNVRITSFENLGKLSSLELHENPWNCNCHLRRFRDWTIIRRLYTRPTSCNEPENLAGKMWDEVDSDDFECRAKILVSPQIELKNDGGDVILWCRTSGIPGDSKLSWIHESRVLNNFTNKHGSDKRYVITESSEWHNLTIPDASTIDKGDYICMAKSPGGNIEQSVSLIVPDENVGGTIDTFGIPLILGLGSIVLLLLLFVLLVVFVWYTRRGRTRQRDKSAEEASLENHPLSEQKSLIVTPAKSVTSNCSRTPELGRSFLDGDSVFVVGPRVAVKKDAEERLCSTPNLDKSTTSRGTNYRHFPPDLLAFAGGQDASPINQTSNAADCSRRTHLQQYGGPQELGATGSPIPGSFPAGYRTLPHNRSLGAGSTHYNSGLAVMLRHGYVTIPRKPRPPSWEDRPPTSPTSPTSPTPGTHEELEPIYDNLGVRTTADGSSVLSLNKNPEVATSPAMRGRALPSKPTGNPHYSAMQRSTPNILASSPLDRSAPEGAPGWPSRLPDDISKRIMQPGDSVTLGRKLPPRPPPKPENKTPTVPLFEDEGEDGTEV